jgi:translation initiation factor IF-2
MESFQENPPETTNPKLLPMKIVFSSVGNINFRDIEIACTAEAKIISYNVSFEKTALQLAKVSEIGGCLVFVSNFYQCLSY